MPLGLKISTYLVERLSKVNDPCIGGLYGVMFDRCLHLIGMSLDLDKTKQVEPFIEMQMKFPTGVDFCGLLSFSENIDTDNVPDIIVKNLKEIIVTDNPVVLMKDIVTGNMTLNFVCNGRLIRADYEVFTLEELYKSLVILRLQTSLFFTASINPDGIMKSIEQLQKMVSSGRVVFNFCNSNVYVNGGDCNEFDDPSQLGFLYDQVLLSRDGKTKQPVMDVSMLIKSSNNSYEDSEHYSPIISSSEIGNSDQIVMMLPIDALCLAQRSRLANETYGLLVDTVCRSIHLFQMSLSKIINSPERISKLKHYHYSPCSLGHCMTLIYPDGSSEEDLFNQRSRLHNELYLPHSIPLFRRANSLSFTAQPNPHTPLINVHEHLRSGGVKGGRSSLVQGYYEYYHYMQNNIDDNGWGCAYRSLQTLFSWFRLQGYTSLNVPSHSEIQRCLVDINDKPEKFVGSKQWIGSTEVAFCLDAMINVSSQILGVSSGNELDTVACQLQTHFDLQGTPVMIGGGVLAHTILGIDFNPVSNEVKFLVLDPHYPGTDDIKIIISRGWISWKTKDFWDKKSFYNMCLPQRPSFI